jgi:hypothetical protein
MGEFFVLVMAIACGITLGGLGFVLVMVLLAVFFGASKGGGGASVQPVRPTSAATFPRAEPRAMGATNGGVRPDA